MMTDKRDFKVKKAETPVKAVIEVPGSKSITNRALLISALSFDHTKKNGESEISGNNMDRTESHEKRSRLSRILFSDDSRVFIKALQDLGFGVSADETSYCAEITGPSRDSMVSISETASLKDVPGICVGSAGTAARFLTALLAFSEGEYFIDASEQMKKRPMLPLFEALTKLGAKFIFAEKEGFLPARVKGIFTNNGGLLSDTAVVDSDASTQFLSALLMMAPIIANRTGAPFYIRVTGSRAQGSYVKMTLKVMKDFGIYAGFDPNENIFTILPTPGYKARDYEIEPDVSAACYFYAAAAITGGEMIVKGVHSDSCQGDIRFLDILSEMGCSKEDTPEGIKIAAPADGILHGVSVDMKDFSDQTMTLAAIAPFCDSPTEISGIGHIRGQESDRIHAVATELGRMGLWVEEGDSSLKIYPGTPKPAKIETYDDHRMAMAFSLIGLRTEGIVIKNYKCCRKTFEDYFETLDSII